MTDDRLRDADPYRPEIIGRLDGAEQTLLEEIMSEDRIPTPWRRRLIAPLAAAAALIAVLAGAAVVSHRSGKPPAPTATGTWSALVLRAAEQNPRLLIDEPGWKVTSVYGFTEQTGEITFTKGDRQLEMNWYPAGQYRSYHDDRLEVSPPKPGTVDSWPGDVFTYSDDDFALMLRPRDDVFAELRTGGRWTRDDFDKVLAHIARVDVATWLAAMPPEVVTPGRTDEAAAKVLEGIPLPPKFDRAALSSVGTNDPYQFGALVVARVGCGWLEEWQRAKTAGDTAALRKADDALRSSHQWKVLQQMNPEGDYPEVFWEIADKTAAGALPAGYQQALGCP